MVSHKGGNFSHLVHDCGLGVDPADLLEALLGIWRGLKRDFAASTVVFSTRTTACCFSPARSVLATSAIAVSIVSLELSCSYSDSLLSLIPTTILSRTSLS